MIIEEKDIESFLSSSSFTGLCALYTINLSYKKKTAFKFNDLFNQIFPTANDYCYGFIVACSSFGLISYNYKNDIMTVTQVNEFILSKIEKEIKDRAISFSSREKDILSLEEYFE